MKRAVLCLLVVASAVSATTLSGALTVDNGFNLYLSTSPNQIGTWINTGDNWQTAYPFSGPALTPGTTYYLQVDATNRADGSGSTYQWGAFLGNFTLSDSLFQFANGGQSLNTNTTDWTYAYTGFDAATLQPAGYALNGGGIWGSNMGHPVSGIDTNAQWIWDANAYNYGPELYFEAEITPVGSPVPEPTPLILLGVALVALGLIERLKRST
jgi:hypothetical protein